MQTASQPFDLGHYDDSPGRLAIRASHRAPEQLAIDRLLGLYDIDTATRRSIELDAASLIGAIRRSDLGAGPIDSLMREYDLSNDEGLVLMMLAEALLRIPDGATRDLMIRDKLGAADFDRHLGQSRSAFVNASTWALAIAGRTLRAAEEQRVWPRMLRRVGEPVLRRAMLQAMALVGGHFVLGKTIDDALSRARQTEKDGFRYSYDMLGEAAMTASDAQRYHDAYTTAIDAIGAAGKGRGPIAGPGISIKLSALHPRYELRHRDRVLTELYPRILELAALAKSYDMGCTIDAEEADRLDLSLDVIGRLIHAPELAGWQGLGLAIQAYSKRVLPLIDWLVDESGKAGRRLMVRLVKGAYWDSEIKRAQEQGLDEYPVYTHKAATDLSYLVAARRILAAGNQLYGQFASHNAATVAAIRSFAKDRTDFEFQRLHGMGEALYREIVHPGAAVACRIYAPVGAHHDLLAYLVRRLLENGSSGSFVNQVANPAFPPEALARDPGSILRGAPPRRIPLSVDLYRPERANSRGIDLGDPGRLESLAASLNSVEFPQAETGPLVGGILRQGKKAREIRNPADRRMIVGLVREATAEDVTAAMDEADRAWRDWDATPLESRAICLDIAADAIEADRDHLIALLIREAGKSVAASIAEVREAADLLRYYAASARSGLATITLPGPTGETNRLTFGGRGIIACIAPWNFPLAIFSGQVAAALVAGNAVMAKPAEQTALIAVRAIQHFHDAGVPAHVLALLPGDGAEVGGALTADPRLAGVAFTGSTATARLINRSLAGRDGPIATLIAETGGINAMIVDSSALLEQATADIMVSAFDSAGQRCSALRCVYVQEEIADDLAKMLAGAIAELQVGDPARLSTDVGPVIDDEALAALEAHAEKIGAPLAVAPVNEDDRPHGTYFAPRAVWIDAIDALKTETFGPILHVARFRSDQFDRVLDAINRTGFGLTLGLQTRIDETVERVRCAARVGNFYVNRTMIGATVGTQPFGGEGLSGTGPKAGGPNYVRRFAVERTVTINTTAAGGNASLLMGAGDSRAE
jgi:RHH-type proline utilization regulon transcriptional repressor/proline dehydrogenase/delta 1-pyrroline-5-carboxylate dehydrogenase